MSKRIFDISPAIHPDHEWWPGCRISTAPFSWQEDADSPVHVCHLDDGNNFTAQVANGMPQHVGAHADAPSHFDPDGPTIDQIALDPFLGKAQVIHIEIGHGEGITPEHLRFAGGVQASRVLIATGTFDWSSGDFPSEPAPAYPTVELIEYLRECGVVLVGIDGPSFDPLDSKELPAHHALKGDKWIANLEGLVLTDVTDGIYELIALPLKILGGDAGMVRAVLREW